MALALFDLDHTLINGDSDQLWGNFLQDIGWVDERYQQRKDEFYRDYLNGQLDYTAFIEFVLSGLKGKSVEEWVELRQLFAKDYLEPCIRSAALSALALHRAQNDIIVMITATNRFIAEAAGQLLNIEHVLASEPEIIHGKFTGKMLGSPCFQQGKIEHLSQFIQQKSLHHLTRHFYSDSHNDLPLLRTVEYAYAVTPDPQLKAHAIAQAWPILTWS